MVTFTGGYAQNVEDTVTIHCNTVVAAKEVFSGAASPKAVSGRQSLRETEGSRPRSAAKMND